jgi:ribosome-binding protein aMBF1 (putative translation factor)
VSSTRANIGDDSETVTLLLTEYEALLEKAESYDELVALQEFHHALDAGQEELIPSDVVEKLVSGQSPIKVWRQYRGLSQAQLAKEIGVSQAYVAQLETRQRQGKPTVLKNIADALGVIVDDLI